MYQFSSVLLLSQEVIGMVWGYQNLSAWTVGNGEKERLLRCLGVNSRSLGTAEWVLLPWEDPEGCDGISSAQGSQFSNRISDSRVPEHPYGLIKFSRGYREGICGSYQVPGE